VTGEGWAQAAEGAAVLAAAGRTAPLQSDKSEKRLFLEDKL